MKRKLLSLLLCLAMVLTLVPLTALADTGTDTVIQSVALLGFEGPYPGETAGSQLHIITRDTDYTVGTVKWYCDTDEGYMGASDVFEAGKKYSLSINLVPTGSATFHEDVLYSTTINGINNYVDKEYSYFSANGSLTIWTVPEVSEDAFWASSLGIFNCYPPVAGDKVGDYCDVYSDYISFCYVYSTQWYCDTDGELLSDTDVFEAGKLYSLCTTLRPQNGYYFDEGYLDPIFVNSSTKSVDTANSYLATNGSYYLWTIPQEPLTPIDTLSVYGTTYPVNDEAWEAHADIYTLDDTYSVTSVQWYNDSEYTFLSAGESFEDGNEYSFRVEVVPAEGYGFSKDLTVYIGPSEERADFDFSMHDLDGNDPYYLLWSVPMLSCQSIISVDVGNYAIPAPGEKPDDHLDVDLGTGAVEILSLDWYCDTDAGYMGASDVFEEGKKYSLRVCVRPTAGNAFSSEMTFSFNGDESLADLEYSYYPALNESYVLWSTPGVCGTPTPAGLTGDVNGDGEVGSPDLTALARHVGGISQITDSALLSNANVNGDGELDSADLTMLARYVGGIINEF